MIGNRQQFEVIILGLYLLRSCIIGHLRQFLEHQLLTQVSYISQLIDQQSLTYSRRQIRKLVNFAQSIREWIYTLFHISFIIQKQYLTNALLTLIITKPVKLVFDLTPLPSTRILRIVLVQSALRREDNLIMKMCYHSLHDNKNIQLTMLILSILDNINLICYDVLL